MLDKKTTKPQPKKKSGRYLNRACAFFFFYVVYIVRGIIMKMTQISILWLQFGNVHAQTRATTSNLPELTALVVCCVKIRVWCVVKCSSDQQFNSVCKLPEDVFKNADPKLAGCRPLQFCMPKWINMHAGAHFWLVQPSVEPYWREIVETQMDG